MWNKYKGALASPFFITPCRRDLSTAVLRTFAQDDNGGQGLARDDKTDDSVTPYANMTHIKSGTRRRVPDFAYKSFSPGLFSKRLDDPSILRFETVLEGDDAVEGIRVLRVLDEVAGADELEVGLV